MQIIYILLFCLLSLLNVSAQELRGHGGPVRALTWLDDRSLISSSFDGTTLLWDMNTLKTSKIFRAHKGSVNSSLALDKDNFVTAGDDGQLIFWNKEQEQPLKIIEMHQAPIVSLGLSSDKSMIATGSWDNKVGLYNINSGKITFLNDSKSSINALSFSENSLFGATYEGKLMRWDAKTFTLKEEIQFDSPLSSLLLISDTQLILGSSQGVLFFYNPQTSKKTQFKAQETPILSLALSPNKKQIALSGIAGSVSFFDIDKHQLLYRLEGPGLPVWSLLYRTNEELVTGGADKLIRRWNVTNGEHLGAILPKVDQEFALGDDAGARVYKACIACHTLTPTEGQRAGPTLFNVIGRKIGSLTDFNYSPALKNNTIIWDKEKIAKLFEVGPTAYLPGTKMPEQVINNIEEREALVEFIGKFSKNK